MPDYIITPNPETHEFKVTEECHLYYHVTLFPRRCRGACVEFSTKGVCRHLDAVERALIDARNAPETDENKLLIETAYIPLKIAHQRSQGPKKAISDSPIDETVKRQDWMD